MAFLSKSRLNLKKYKRLDLKLIIIKMALYQCECNYETNRKDGMQRHLNRKKTCMFGKDMSLINVNTLLVEDRHHTIINNNLILYRCLCNHETNKISSMKIHLNKEIPCIPGRDMLLIDIKTLVVKRFIPDLSTLTQEEKNQRNKNRSLLFSANKYKLGNLDIEQFAKNLLSSMKNNSKRRNHKVHFTLDDIVKLLRDNNKYIIPNTVLGKLIFPLQLTNGYYNTSSFDRINDDLGYSNDNIEIRPHFLNTPFKLTTQNIKDIIKIRELKQDLQELINIVNYINTYNKSTHFFYKLAMLAKVRSKKRNMNFNFETITDCAHMLIRKYINQGGRCVYSNIPIYPENNHLYKMSPERLNPNKSYSEENTVLIVAGLNGSPAGQWKNKLLTSGEREIALEAGKFNQEYWDKCTKITSDIKFKYEEAREYGCKILLENLSKEMKFNLFN